MRALEAWWQGRHIGHFLMDGSTVSFEYDDDAPEFSISLSLPRHDRHSKRGAENFLGNLLPDNARAREALARSYGASSTSPFSLLERAGGDVSGGVLLLPEGASPPSERRLTPASETEIANRIEMIRRDEAAWTHPDIPARFSLGGYQGKFAAARVGDDWYWSNSTVPSTHIFKPEPTERARGLERAEAATLALANEVGIEAAHAEVMRFGGQTTFATERFDRDASGEIASRVHAEDMAQVLGRDPSDKYKIGALAVTRALEPHDPDGSIRREFIRQLAFNTMVGNADAHAKNYSVLLDEGPLRMSPIYDSAPLGIYPQYSQELAMSVSGADYPAAADAPHWRKIAFRSGVDPEAVLNDVTLIAEGIAERADTAWVSLDDDHAEVARNAVLRNTKKLVESGGGKAISLSPSDSSTRRQRRRPRGVPSGGEFMGNEHDGAAGL